MWSKNAPKAIPAEPETRVLPSPSPRKDESKDESVKIGKTVLVKGELTGDENLTIEGRVEGRIELRNHQLIIGPGGRVHAEILAKTVTVIGQVEGNVQATEVVEIRESGSLLGDIRAPRVVIANGANFKGSVDMVQPGPGTSRGTPEMGPSTARGDKAVGLETKPALSLQAGALTSGAGKVPIQ